jgi:hypothetical protein
MNQNSNAQTAWKWAVAAVYFIAAMNFLLGWLANSTPSMNMASGPMIWAGVLFVVLGVFAQNRAKPALWTALVIYALDSIGTVYISITSGHFAIWMVFLRIGLLRVMYAGIEALDAMAQNPAK